MRNKLIRWANKPFKECPAYSRLFISDLTQHIYNLTENYRTINDPEFGSILERLRTGTTTDDDTSK